MRDRKQKQTKDSETLCHGEMNKCLFRIRNKDHPNKQIGPEAVGMYYVKTTLQN